MGVKSRFSNNSLGEPVSFILPQDDGENGSPNEHQESFNRPARATYLGYNLFFYEDTLNFVAFLTGQLLIGTAAFMNKWVTSEL